MIAPAQERLDLFGPQCAAGRGHTRALFRAGAHGYRRPPAGPVLTGAHTEAAISGSGWDIASQPSDDGFKLTIFTGAVRVAAGDNVWYGFSIQPPGGCRYSKETMVRLDADGRI